MSFTKESAGTASHYISEKQNKHEYQPLLE